MTERAGLYTVVRIAAYGDVARDEWINVGVIVGDRDGTKWHALVTSDWNMVTQRARVNLTSGYQDVIKAALGVRSWGTINELINSESSGWNCIAYTHPRAVLLINPHLRITARILFDVFVGTPADDVEGHD